MQKKLADMAFIRANTAIIRLIIVMFCLALAL